MSNDTGQDGRRPHSTAPAATEREKLLARLGMAVRANQDATHQIDEVAGEAMGLNGTDGRCLDIIDRLGPIAAGTLAREAGLTTGAVTAVLDHLEEKRYVRRLRDPDDRRRVLVEVTDRARKTAMELYGPISERAQEFLDRLSDDELRLLIEFSETGRRIQEERAAEIRAQLS